MSNTPIFLVSDLEYFQNDFENTNICVYKENNSDIVSQYKDFRSKTHVLGSNINEFVFVYVRKLNNNFGDEIPKLLKDLVFVDDVNSFFIIDVTDKLAVEIKSADIEKIKTSNLKVINEEKYQLFNYVFSKSNDKGEEINEVDIYNQTSNFINAINFDFNTVFNYSKESKGNIFYLNSFGSSRLVYPNLRIKDSIKCLYSLSQILYLLKENDFNKEELNNALNLKLELDEENLTKVLNSYSNEPDQIDVIAAANRLYDDCDVNNLKNSFDNLELFPFSSFLSQSGESIIDLIELNQNDFLYDLIKRTSNSMTETDVFFREIDERFKNYKNEELIRFHQKLNENKNKEIDSWKNKIDRYISNSVQNAEIENKKYTMFELLSSTLFYFGFGKENNEIDHDKNLLDFLKTVSEKSAKERVQLRRDLSVDFKRSLESRKESLKFIDDELEDKNGVVGYLGLRELRRELSFSFLNNERPFYDKMKYSFLQKTSIVTVLTSFILFISFFVFSKITEFSLGIYSILTFLSPFLIGGLVIYFKYREYSQLKKHIKSLINSKTLILSETITLHNNFIKSYLNNIKTEFSIDIIKEIQSFCKLKSQYIENFRGYLLKRYIMLVNQYKDIDYAPTTFENSLITQELIEDAFFKYSTPSFFDENLNKKSEFFKSFVSSSLKNIDYSFSLDISGINFFEESNIFNDIVESLDEDDNLIQYHNKFDKEPKLYLSEDGNNPIDLSDIKQGKIGNCYYLASLGAIAKASPSYLRKMITIYDEDGNSEGEFKNQTFLVRFFDSKKNERFVAIDNKFWFYENSLNPVYANFSSIKESYEIWVMVLEKAWAKINGGYSNIVGSSSDSSFSKIQRKHDFGLTLSGNYIDYKVINDFDDSKLRELVSEKIRAKIPIVVYSKEKCKSKNVVESHAYTLIGLKSGHFSLYNPHGENHLEKFSINDFRVDFEWMLFFDLKEPNEFDLHPSKILNNSMNEELMEKEFNIFFGDKFYEDFKSDVTSMLKIERNVNLSAVLKRLDNTSCPLFGINRNSSGEDVYNVLYKREDNEFDYSIFDKKPVIKDSNLMNNDIYILLSKYVSYKI